MAFGSADVSVSRTSFVEKGDPSSGQTTQPRDGVAAKHGSAIRFAPMKQRHASLRGSADEPEKHLPFEVFATVNPGASFPSTMDDRAGSGSCPSVRLQLPVRTRATTATAAVRMR